MKKILSFVLGFVLLFSLFPSLNVDAAMFNDVKQYEKEIDFLKSKGVISGYPDGSFKPNASVTRLQAISMILREKGIKDFAAPDPKFTDMKPGSYGYTEVAKAVQLGFISGKTAPNGTKYFDPYATLTRSQFAKIIVEGYGLPTSEHYTFYDVPKYHPSAKYVSTLAKERITTGYTDGTFKPNGKISRQHFAAFFSRMLDNRFKPNAPVKNVSYAMDPTKTYVFRNNDGLTTYKFTDEKYYEYDIWNVISKGINEDFIVKEDHTGHYTGYMGSHFWQDLKYPVKIGLKWGTEDEPGGFDVGISTITSTTETVTTPAGTFWNVVVVKNSYGNTSYYAQNVGLVKSVNDGNVHELVEIK